MVRVGVQNKVLVTSLDSGIEGVTPLLSVAEDELSGNGKLKLKLKESSGPDAEGTMVAGNSENEKDGVCSETVQKTLVGIPTVSVEWIPMLIELEALDEKLTWPSGNHQGSSPLPIHSRLIETVNSKSFPCSSSPPKSLSKIPT
jgi:hypothetical protein